MNVETYQHSGRMGGTAIPMMAILGGGAAVVLGIIYAYAIAWIPVVQICFFATLFFGAGIGFAVSLVGKAGKVRNNLLMLVFGLLLALVGLYTAWAFDGIARHGADAVDHIMWQPRELSMYVQMFYEEGFWGVGNDTWSGPGLAGVWAVEALITIGLACLVAGFSTKQLPFCEECNRWTDHEEGFCSLLPPEDDDTALERLCDGDLSGLESFSLSPPGAAAFVRIDTAVCPDCSNSNFLTIHLATITVDKDGNAGTKTVTLVQNMKLSATDMERLRETVPNLDVGTLPEGESDDADS